MIGDRGSKVNSSFFLRYSGDFSDGLGPLQSKIGQNNGGYVPYVDYAHDYNMPLHVNTNGQLPNGNMSLTRHRELRQDNGLPSIGSGMGSLSNSLMSKSPNQTRLSQCAHGLILFSQIPPL